MAKTKFWRDGLKFECRQCGHCCSFPGGAVHVTEREFKQIADFLSLDFETFLLKYTTLIDGYTSLKSTPGGPCIFYDSGCRIYPVRPTQCRTYPFWRDILKSALRWQQAGATCPGIDAGRMWSKASIQQLLIQNNKDFFRFESK